MNNILINKFCKIIKLVILFLFTSYSALMANDNASVNCNNLEQLALLCIKISGNTYSIGQLDRESNIIYVWKDIIMTGEEAFDHHLSQRSPIIFPEKNGYILKEVTPCIFFLKTDERYEIGYWDAPTGTFFRWRGIQFDSLNIPEAFQKNLVIIEKNKISAKYDIPIPARFWESLFPHSSDGEKETIESE